MKKLFFFLLTSCILIQCIYCIGCEEKVALGKDETCQKRLDENEIGKYNCVDNDDIKTKKLQPCKKTYIKNLKRRNDDNPPAQDNPPTQDNPPAQDNQPTQDNQQAQQNSTENEQRTNTTKNSTKTNDDTTTSESNNINALKMSSIALISLILF